MAVEIISPPIIARVWDQARIELETPGSAVIHVTNSTTQPSMPPKILQELNGPKTVICSIISCYRDKFINYSHGT